MRYVSQYKKMVSTCKRGLEGEFLLVNQSSLMFGSMIVIELRTFVVLRRKAESLDCGSGSDE